MNAYRLTQGMFGTEMRPVRGMQQDEFYLSCGQCRSSSTSFSHNAGWHNARGEKIGWGDLSTLDLRSISNLLEDGELFIVLPERASFWKFVTKPGLIGSMSAVDRPTEQNPGVEYVAENASYIIGKHQFWAVDDDHTGSSVSWKGAIEFTYVTHRQARKMMEGASKALPVTVSD